MSKIGLSETYIQAIWNIYLNSKRVIKVGKYISEFLPVTKGFKQGCWSPTLFKIYKQEALSELEKKGLQEWGVKVKENSLTILLNMNLNKTKYAVIKNDWEL